MRQNLLFINYFEFRSLRSWSLKTAAHYWKGRIENKLFLRRKKKSFNRIWMDLWEKFWICESHQFIFLFLSENLSLFIKKIPIQYRFDCFLQRDFTKTLSKNSNKKIAFEYFRYPNFFSNKKSFLSFHSVFLNKKSKSIYSLHLTFKKVEIWGNLFKRGYDQIKQRIIWTSGDIKSEIQLSINNSWLRKFFGVKNFFPSFQILWKKFFRYPANFWIGELNFLAKKRFVKTSSSAWFSFIFFCFVLFFCFVFFV